eukprot:gene1517-biopygen1520
MAPPVAERHPTPSHTFVSARAISTPPIPSHPIPFWSSVAPRCGARTARHRAQGLVEARAAASRHGAIISRSVAEVTSPADLPLLGLAPATREKHGRKLRQFAAYLHAHPPASGESLEQAAQRWAHSCLARGLKPGTVAGYVRALRAALAHQGITVSPQWRMMVRGCERLEVWADVRRAEPMLPHDARTALLSAGVREAAMLAFLWGAGCRVNDLWGVLAEDCVVARDPLNGWGIEFHPRRSKSRQTARSGAPLPHYLPPSPFADAVMRLLAEHRQGLRQGSLFGGTPQEMPPFIVPRLAGIDEIPPVRGMPLHLVQAGASQFGRVRERCMHCVPGTGAPRCVVCVLGGQCGGNATRVDPRADPLRSARRLVEGGEVQHPAAAARRRRPRRRPACGGGGGGW